VAIGLQRQNRNQVFTNEKYIILCTVVETFLLCNKHSQIVSKGDTGRHKLHETYFS
jgi:hypothetical protein